MFHLNDMIKRTRIALNKTLRKRRLSRLDRIIKEEKENPYFLQVWELDLLQKNIASMSRHEYQEYLELYSVIKACSYQRYFKERRSRRL